MLLKLEEASVGLLESYGHFQFSFVNQLRIRNQITSMEMEERLAINGTKNFGGIDIRGDLSFLKDKLRPVPTIRAFLSFYFDALLHF